ncbi:MAG: cysteine peptidase family C39 domain-containing protein, partial [Bacteroidota bacterium]
MISHNTVSTLLDMLAIKHTRTYLSSLFLELGKGKIYHNKVRTLLSAYRLDTMAIQITEQQLSEIPLPALVMLQENGGNYAVLEAVKGEEVQLFKQEKSETISKEAFIRNWTGYTILIQKNEHSGEPHYQENLAQERKAKQKQVFSWALAAVLVVAFLTQVSLMGGLWVGAFAVLHLLGLGLSGVLLSGELSAQNPLFTQVCKALSVGGKSNCQSLKEETNEKYQLFGFSWAEIGVFYFAGGLAALWVSGAVNLLFAVAILGIVAVGVSLYVQGVKERKWCALCLSVMAVLFLESALGFMQVWINGFAFSWTYLPVLAVTFGTLPLI